LVNIQANSINTLIGKEREIKTCGTDLLRIPVNVTDDSGIVTDAPKMVLRG